MNKDLFTLENFVVWLLKQPKRKSFNNRHVGESVITAFARQLYDLPNLQTDVKYCGWKWDDSE